MTTNEFDAHPNPSGFLSYVDTYLPAEGQAAVRRALKTAYKAHEGVMRLSGESYLAHVMAVAKYLAEWRAPADVLVAGLLHDAHKPNYATPLSIDEIGEMFGVRVAEIVRDVARLGRLGHVYPSEEAALLSDDFDDVSRRLPWAANILYRSPIAVMIKLADRLHNFQSLTSLPEERQITYAMASRNIFSPFAERLGMRAVKRLIDDYAFQVLQPEAYAQITAEYEQYTDEQEIAPVMARLQSVLAGAGTAAQVSSRARSYADLYRRKMEKGRPLSAQTGRIIVVKVPDVMACYQALGVVHTHWQPLPDTLKDMIALPRVNGYRGIHTSIRTATGEVMRLAIRDHQMDLVADYGLAAGWQNVPDSRLPKFPEWREPPAGQIAVLTPDGDVKMLPQGSTPVDLAYAIHNQLGNQCTLATVNGRMAPLTHPLESGDVVDIVPSRASVGPLPEWLNFVKTPKARLAIRRWLRVREPTKAAEAGWQLLEQTMRREQMLLSALNSTPRMEQVARELGFESRHKLLVDIGLEQYPPQKVVDKLRKQVEIEQDAPALRPAVLALADASMQQRLAKCCNPLPPDPLVAYVTQRNVASIHRADCSRVKHLRPLVNAEWPITTESRGTEIEIMALDRPGLVRDISGVAAEQGLSMFSFHADRMLDGSAIIQFGLGNVAPDAIQWLIGRIREVDGVRQVKSQLPSLPANLEAPTTLARHFHNPYTLGPVSGEGFFGRRQELRELVNNLRNLQPGEAVLLWGPRRIGKTSLLLRFRQYVMSDNSENYVLAYVDMQRVSGHSTTMFLREIIRAIVEAIPGANLTPPKYSRMKRDPMSYFRGFLEQQPALQGKLLVLILDEFQILSTLDPEVVSLEDINRYFRSQIQHRQGMCVIFSGGGVLDYLLAQPETSFMLEAARQQHIGSLAVSDARQLIMQPQQRVNYDDTAVDHLLAVTAGHPYLLQWLCSELVVRAEREQRDRISIQHVQDALTDWLPYQGEHYFSHLWGSGIGLDLRTQQLFKLVLTAVSEVNGQRPDESRWVKMAEVEVISRNGRALGDILGLDRLQQALQNLVKMDTLESEKDSYRIRVALCEQWLQANHTLAQLIKENQW